MYSCTAVQRTCVHLKQVDQVNRWLQGQGKCSHQDQYNRDHQVINISSSTESYLSDQNFVVLDYLNKTSETQVWNKQHFFISKQRFLWRWFTFLHLVLSFNCWKVFFGSAKHNLKNILDLRRQSPKSRSKIWLVLILRQSTVTKIYWQPYYSWVEASSCFFLKDFCLQFSHFPKFFKLGI